MDMNYQRFVGPAVILIAALAVAAALGAPVLAYVPIALVVLACPLMMVFMMKGMHGGHTDQTHSQPTTGAREGEGR
jgi:hypothetical protein